MTLRAALLALAGALLLTALTATGEAHAQDYLSQFPQSSQVLADWKGADSSETALRQLAAFTQLRSILFLMSRGPSRRTQPTPAVREVERSYVAAMATVREPHFNDAETRRLGMQSPRAQWLARRAQYEQNKGFRAQVLAKYFTPEFRAKFEPLAAAEDARNKAAVRLFMDGGLRQDLAQKERMRIPFLIVAGAYIALAVRWITRKLVRMIKTSGVRTCDKCGKLVSRAAPACPHCGAAPEARLGRMLPCRQCKTMLRENVHRVVLIETVGSSYIPGSFSGTVIGNTVSGTVTGGTSVPLRDFVARHVPCPQCGEPAPLRRIMDLGFVYGLVKTLIVFILVIGLPLLLLLSHVSISVGFGTWFLAFLGFSSFMTRSRATNSSWWNENGHKMLL